MLRRDIVPAMSTPDARRAREPVLRFGSNAGAGAAVFRTLLGYPQLQVEDRSAVLQALALYDQGLDFGDALHLASSGDSDRLATFDQPLAKKTQGLEGTPAVVLLRSTAG